MFKRALLLLALCLAQYGIQPLWAAQWSGSVEAHLDLDTPQYSRYETQAYLAGNPAKTLDVHVKGGWTATVPMPLGECTLSLLIERK
jgi:hypothetical protein